MVTASPPGTPIPIVDFAAWGGDTDDRVRVGHALAAACRKFGFVYIVNHGVPDHLVSDAFSMSQRLFALSMEQKKTAPHPPGFTVHRGYSWPGLEKVGNSNNPESREIEDCKESYEVGSEENGLQPNVWLPEDVLPGFRAFSTSFYWKCHEASLEIVKALALGIGLSSPQPLLRHHDGHGNQLRFLHYPPVQAKLIEEGRVARMPAHSDWGTITLLFQDECGGLQVESPDETGKFLDVFPVSGAMCLNVGDALQRWSNDYLKSTLHRVALPSTPHGFTGTEDEKLTRSRYSIVYFVAPALDSLIECLPSCQGPENLARHTAITWKDYMLMRASTQYAGS
ncbi:Clavaminate synthase-like protein [Auricularia subglabra TFB-10046 SS5]|nr:Clavaminate synthase-like protein [Auricularia subglabra TFB-10046 SS5]